MSDSPKKPNVKLFWLSALVVLVVFGAYRVVVMMVENGSLAPVWFSVLMWSYMLLASAAFITVVTLQRGFSNKPLMPDDLPDSMTFSEKSSAIEADKRRKKLAKIFLIPLIAFILVFLYEIIEIYYFPAIAGWFSSLNGSGN